MKKNQLYCVVYRTGGLKNFKWHRSSAMTHAEAFKAVEKVRLGGRRAYLVDYKQSLIIGLPETFSAGDKYVYTVDDARDYPGVAHVED